MSAEFVFSPALQDLSAEGRAWPFEEAKKLVARLERTGQKSVIFETGYGPSGLPHIGTFGEVARTTMVRHAFRTMTGDQIPTRLLCFSDDLDGLRKVPDNVPNKDLLAQNLDKPLTQVPDPFGEFPSFGAHNNAMLRRFLDQFGFDYEFVSATEMYQSGTFDETLLRVLANYDKIMAIMLPTLREERQQTYSPILPICPRRGLVLQVPLTNTDVGAGTVTYLDPETKDEVTVSVKGGQCKLQWKADWAMRWVALGVDFEMAGKDLIDSVKLANKICRVLGSEPPEGFNYELFLDVEGKKISKSKGNGLSIDDWLTYATPESLALFMYQRPRQAKRLFIEMIPQQVDEYYAHLASYPALAPDKQIENPVWHIHHGRPPEAVPGINFSMLLNLVSASNAEQKSILWGFLQRYDPELTPESAPELDKLVGYAIRYFQDFVAPKKVFRKPDAREAEALRALLAGLQALPAGTPGPEIQNLVYQIGKDAGFEPLKSWFQALYQVLLGQDQGPRFGSFVALYGIPETCAMIESAL